MRHWAAKLGPWWYALPGLLVMLIGFATCHLVDVTDFDRYQVEAVVSFRSGQRHAVAVRHWHADSAATVTCIWIVAGPAPELGPTRRLSETCALIATDPDARLQMRWQDNGRLLVILPPGMPASKTDARSLRCYFEKEQLGRHACYSPDAVDIDAG